MEEIFIGIISFLGGAFVWGVRDQVTAWFWNLLANHIEGKRTYYNALKSDLKLAVKKINKDASINSKMEVDIKIINADEPSLDYFESKMILRISTKKTILENTKNLLKNLTKEAILWPVYNKLKSFQRESVEDFVTKELCAWARQRKAAEDLHDTIQYKSNYQQEYESYIVKYQEVSENGLFFSIFIPEVRRMGKVTSTAYNEANQIQQEYDKLLNFLYKIATKEPGEDVDLQHQSPLIKIGVILVARRETWEYHGTTAYVKRAKEFINKRYQTIYTVSAGRNNEYSKEVVRAIYKNLPVRTHPKKDIKISPDKVIRIYRIDVNI